jgi:ADP-heptose:LPS heptosyltransferase
MAVASSQVRRVLVLSPNWLGDAVMALPAIADVRRSFTGTRLTVAARKSVAICFV